jgi:glycosyltransferase 2 family protein
MNFLRACGRFFEQKIGLHRLGIVLSLIIIAIAAVVLYRKLQTISVSAVLTAMAAVEYRDVAIAALFVALGYFTLTFYDLFALRTIGRKDVPYRVAALAGFTSYSVGHNVGASVFTGGAVRYRIYSGWGLDAVEVAKICFVAGLTFWLGNITVLGFGFAYHPEAAAAIDHLPLWLNRMLGITALLVLAGYIAWVWRTPRIIGRQNWQVQLPNGPLTLLQILIGIIDLGCCALAMYVLVPNTPHIEFVDVAVIFITATLLGFASHSPGGLGVFDGAMLWALWQYDGAELVAGLLIFRLLYYILPFTLALATLGIRELSLHIAGRRNVGDG